MNNKYFNQKGLTLVELLAAIVLTAVVSIFLISLTSKALENTRIISQETILRDEADIIVSKFIKALYSTKQEHIIRNVTTIDKNSYLEVVKEITKCQKDENDNFIIIKDECELNSIGFITDHISEITKIYILNEVYEIKNDAIKINKSSKIVGKPEETTIYEIELNLDITYKRGKNNTEKQMTFKNEIQSIVNFK